MDGFLTPPGDVLVLDNAPIHIATQFWRTDCGVG